MTVTPWAIADAQVERVRKHFKDAEVPEIAHDACNAVFFNRATTATSLPLEERYGPSDGHHSSQS
jgi:hypothetical protein